MDFKRFFTITGLTKGAILQIFHHPMLVFGLGSLPLVLGPYGIASSQKM
jgi:hypothetical protein